MALDVLALQVGHVLDRRAEARRADHCAVAAREAAVGDILPAGVLIVAVQQRLDVGRVELAPHLRGGARMHLVGPCAVEVERLAMRHLRQDLRAALRPDLDGEIVLTVIQDLRQREVEAQLGDRPGVNRDAEAGPARLAALDGDDEQLVGPGAVGGIRMPASEQYLVEDPDRVQLA